MEDLTNVVIPYALIAAGILAFIRLAGKQILDFFSSHFNRHEMLIQDAMADEDKSQERMLRIVDSYELILQDYHNKFGVLFDKLLSKSEPNDDAQ